LPVTSLEESEEGWVLSTEVTISCVTITICTFPCWINDRYGAQSMDSNWLRERVKRGTLVCGSLTTSPRPGKCLSAPSTLPLCCSPRKYAPAIWVTVAALSPKVRKYIWLLKTSFTSTTGARFRLKP